MTEIAARLAECGRITRSELKSLLLCNDEKANALLAEAAVKKTFERFGNRIYIRGLIEISSFCRNNCLYCGLRASNAKAVRMRLSPEEILSCCRKGYGLGFRTFVLQGGEDPFFSDSIAVPLVRSIRNEFPDCAITLSLGERSTESYAALFEAGADRYLLRHESAAPQHYAQLHPKELSYDNRIHCLHTLKKLGYQTGCGFMVGSPYQTIDCILDDLEFIADFKPEMCGIGPFIPQSNTPFAGFPAGSAALTENLLSIIRLMLPDVMLPSTTALGSVEADGRLRGILSGANVLMPNLTPDKMRESYTLYNNKDDASAKYRDDLEALDKKLRARGYELAFGVRGDHSGYCRTNK